MISVTASSAAEVLAGLCRTMFRTEAAMRGMHMLMLMPHLFLVAGKRGYELVTSAAGRPTSKSEVDAAACLAFHRANPALLGAEVPATETPKAVAEDDYQFSA